MFLTDHSATQVGTIALVPQVVDAVKVPVIAAGGIADARGIAAAFALGAAAVQIGIRSSGGGLRGRYVTPQLLHHRARRLAPLRA